jgi:hypothetical protein
MNDLKILMNSFEEQHCVTSEFSHVLGKDTKKLYVQTWDTGII